MTKLKQLHSIPSTKFWKHWTYFSVPNSCTPFIMVDYIITLITSLLRLNQSTNIKQDLHISKISFTQNENVSGSAFFKVYWSRDLV